MLRQRVSIPLIMPSPSPEQNLQEISMLQDQHNYEQFKTPLHSYVLNLNFDGWIKSPHHNQDALTSFKSNVLRPYSPKHHRKNPVLNFSHFVSNESNRRGSDKQLKPQSPHFRMRKSLSHEFQSNQRNVFHIEQSLGNLSKTHGMLENNTKLQADTLRQTHKSQYEAINKRKSVEAVNYPIFKGFQMERKLRSSVGRVRRLLKSKPGCRP